MSTPRVGLVLGAGGTAGVAFHAGTLLALEQDTGWDPRTADVIVGTSAGSIVAALLRAGLSTDDLAAWGTSTPPRPDGHHIRDVLDRVDDMGLRFVGPRPWLRVPSPRWWWQVASPSEVRPHTAVLSLLPHGVIDAASALRETAPLLPGWPDQPLYINAVRAADARRVVFGRDVFGRDVSGRDGSGRDGSGRDGSGRDGSGRDVSGRDVSGSDEGVTVTDAIAASCAIPGVFRPVRIGRHWYIDGGAHSPTNADVLVDAGVDVAVVLSPMSGRRGAIGRRPDLGVRALFRRRLHREVTALRDAGIETEVFEPTADTLRAMGWNALDRSRASSVVASAFLGAGVGRFVHEPATSVLNRLRALAALPAAS